MKLFFIIMMTFSMSAFASLDCQSTSANPGYRVTVLEFIGKPPALIIKHEGKKIYRLGVVSITEPNRSISYRSLSFTNSNNAPAGLFLSIYQNGNEIIGSFNEGSYLPVVPYLELTCSLF